MPTPTPYLSGGDLLTGGYMFVVATQDPAYPPSAGVTGGGGGFYTPSELLDILHDVLCARCHCICDEQQQPWHASLAQVDLDPA